MNLDEMLRTGLRRILLERGWCGAEALLASVAGGFGPEVQARPAGFAGGLRGPLGAILGGPR